MSTTRVTKLDVKQLDEQRLKCIVTLSDHQSSPEIIIEITSEAGDTLANMAILESPDLENSYVIHIPANYSAASVNVNAYLKSDTLGIIHHEETIFQLKK